MGSYFCSSFMSKFLNADVDRRESEATDDWFMIDFNESL